MYILHKFPTDGDSGNDQKVREPRKRPIRCDSGTDSIVWMGEDANETDFFCAAQNEAPRM